MRAVQNDPVFICPSCRGPLKPLKTNPALGFLCFACPAILTSFPEGLYHVREIWSGREYTTTLQRAQRAIPMPNGPEAVASDPMSQMSS